MEIPERPQLPDGLPDDLIKYITDLEELVELKTVYIKHKGALDAIANNIKYRNLNRSLKATNLQKDAQLKELRKKYKELQHQHSMELKRKQPKEIDYVLAPTDFIIKQTTYDLLKFDVFESRVLRPRHIRDLHMTIKAAKFFLLEDCKYDLATVMILLFANPIEFFLVEDVVDLIQGVSGSINAHKRINKLVRHKYISYNVIQKRDIKKGRVYYITDKGRKAVNEFLKDYREIQINIDFYERNFRRAYYSAQEPSREKFGFGKQYRTVYGQSFQSEFARAKSIDGYSRKRASTQPSQSKEG